MMTIEEKAKAYDEAIKVLHKYDGANIMFSQSLKEEMFPELKESENERIRKFLVELVSNDKHNGFGALYEDKGVTYDDVLAWLEKQDVQTIKEALRTEYEKGRADAIAEMQKPVEWGEEDNALIENICTALKGYALHERKVNLDEHAHRLEEMVEKLKFFKFQSHWKPSDKQINILFKYAEQNNYDGSILTSLYNDLKKL